MTQFPQVQKPYPSAPAEIAVALGHLDRVCGVLKRAHVPYQVIDQSTELDLALVRLAISDVMAADALDRLEPMRPRDPMPIPGDDLGRAIAAVRRHFTHRHHGWTVTMGKNRNVGSVGASGSTDGGAISYGGGGSPRAKWLGVPRTSAVGPGVDVHVGVLDTALFAHPWLKGRWTAGRSDLLEPRKGQVVEAGHATFVTGLILAQAPGATVDVRRVLTTTDMPEPTARPAYTATAWEVARQIVSFRSSVEILNLSMVCHTEDGAPPLVLERAIERLGSDVVVVAAAGNHGTLPRSDGAGLDADSPAFPAALDGVVAVGAADAKGRPLPFTPVNKLWIDLLVRGDDLVSTYLSGRLMRGDGSHKRFLTKWARWSGSSFAAAMLSGAIAAGTDPGRVTARESLENIRRTAEREGPAFPYTPPFVKL